MSQPSPQHPHRQQQPGPHQPPPEQYQPSQPAVYGSQRQAYPVQPAAQPYGYQQPMYVPPAVSTTSVTKGGLPTWMHLCYAFLGWIPCFLGWVIWPIHWWFAKSKSVTVAQTGVVYQPPPQQWGPTGPR